ncbi:MAG: hypothetical protein HRU31_13345, partial [Rhodobacteraceae bacterium]|nr:hypothetical protein [Paracoccaceae bacterium]
GDVTIGERFSATGDSLALSTTGALDLGDTAMMRATTGDLSLSAGAGATIGTGLGLTADAGALTVGVTGAFDIGATASLQSFSGPLTVNVDGDARFDAGYDLTTTGQSIMLAVTGDLDQSAGGSVTSQGGAIDMDVGGNALLSAGSTVYSKTGTIDVDVAGDMVIGQFETTNATDLALVLSVGGTLTMQAGTGTTLTANEKGALTTLRLGALANAGPIGLTTQVDRLDATVTAGDLHVLETDAVRLEAAQVTDAVVDVFARGDLIVGNVAAGAGDVVLSWANSLRSDAATITGATIGLYAFGGEMAGETLVQFTADTSAGAELGLFALGNLGYRETAGDVLIGYALSQTGSLALDVDAGNLTVGLLGAAGDITLSANGDLDMARIGEARIDLRDETALRLVEPSFYGLRAAVSPRTATLIAYGDGSALTGGLISAKDKINLRGDIVTADLHDETPEDGLIFTIRDGQEQAADEVVVNTLGEGDMLTVTDPFDITNPDVETRDPAVYVATLQDVFIGTGEVNHSGPVLLGERVVIEDDTYFRQGGFSLFAQTTYDDLSTVDTAQVLANLGGEIGFTIFAENNLLTDRVLVLNRREKGVSVNGGQGFVYGIGVETSIDTVRYGSFGDSTNVFRNGALGVTGFPLFNFTGFASEEEDELQEVLDSENWIYLGSDTVRLPFTIASLD